MTRKVYKRLRTPRFLWERRVCSGSQAVFFSTGNGLGIIYEARSAVWQSAKYHAPLHVHVRENCVVCAGKTFRSDGMMHFCGWVFERVSPGTVIGMAGSEHTGRHTFHTNDAHTYTRRSRSREKCRKRRGASGVRPPRVRLIVRMYVTFGVQSVRARLCESSSASCGFTRPRPANLFCAHVLRMRESQIVARTRRAIAGRSSFLQRVSALDGVMKDYLSSV